MNHEKTCQKIIEEYLITNEYDGLYHPDEECGCLLNDLAPCGNSCLSCLPGVRLEPSKLNHDFVVGPKNTTILF